MRSNVQQRGRVSFPEFTGERVYMREFTKASGLPRDLRRWQDTVDAMLDGIDAAGPIYLMVDQGFVRGGVTHRRPGAHVDGYWNPGIQAHGQPSRPGHGRGIAAAPMHIHMRGDHGHCHAGNEAEALLLATDVFGCVGYVGSCEGAPGQGGDCAHIALDGMQRVDMEPGLVWAGHTLTMLHESVPAARDCFRTVVRLNVPGWEIA